MIDTTLGKSYQHMICKRCREKVAAETKGINKIDLMFPRKIINRFKGLLCKNCEAVLVKEMRKNAK